VARKMMLNYDKVRLAMARNSFSVPDLAKVYGISRQRMQVIINSRNVSTKTAGRLAKALAVDVTEIID
jgi:DNA-binding Xre family transcriptional regulator